MKKLTREQLRVEIARLLGWTHIESSRRNDGFIRVEGVPPATDKISRAFLASFGGDTCPFPAFEGRVSEAWLLVDLLNTEGWLVVVRSHVPGEPFYTDDDLLMPVRFRACATASWMKRETNEDIRKYIFDHPAGLADTVPLAICKLFYRIKTGEDVEVEG